MSTPFATKMIKINKTTPDKHKYLAVLGMISKPPKNIFFTGTLPEVRRPTVAIVGTRKPTAYGREVTHKLAYAATFSQTMTLMELQGTIRGLGGNIWTLY